MCRLGRSIRCVKQKWKGVFVDMYIKSGIAYAGEAPQIMKISGVRPMDGHKLWVRFLNGETKVFDFTPLLNTPAFQPLQNIETFRSVYIDYGVPVWNDGDIDIAPEYLYQNGVSFDSIVSA